MASASRNKASGSVRIIGGQWRGRKLPVANSEGLRPTTDRVRETLFNWLQFELAGKRCLDLFSGSGSLAFEALSRGASAAVMVERKSAVAEQLKANTRTLGATADVVTSDAIRYLQGVATPFDVVFLDPPFRTPLLAESIQLLAEADWLNDNAWIYVEAEQDFQGRWPSDWQLHREKTAGQVAYRLFRRTTPVNGQMNEQKDTNA